MVIRCAREPKNVYVCYDKKKKNCKHSKNIFTLKMLIIVNAGCSSTEDKFQIYHHHGITCTCIRSWNILIRKSWRFHINKIWKTLHLYSPWSAVIGRHRLYFTQYIVYLHNIIGITSRTRACVHRGNSITRRDCVRCSNTYNIIIIVGGNLGRGGRYAAIYCDRFTKRPEGVSRAADCQTARGCAQLHHRPIDSLLDAHTRTRTHASYIKCIINCINTESTRFECYKYRLLVLFCFPLEIITSGERQVRIILYRGIVPPISVKSMFSQRRFNGESTHHTYLCTGLHHHGHEDSDFNKK